MRPLFRLLLFLAVVLGKAAPPLEAELYPGYNRMYSNVNGSYHPGWELWAEAKVGYTVDFAADRLFLHPAGGGCAPSEVSKQAHRSRDRAPLRGE